MRCTSREPHAGQTKRRDLEADKRKLCGVPQRIEWDNPGTLAISIQAKRSGGLKALALQIGDGRGGAHGYPHNFGTQQERASIDVTASCKKAARIPARRLPL
jgi:hypothetical protein